MIFTFSIVCLHTISVDGLSNITNFDGENIFLETLEGPVLLSATSRSIFKPSLKTKFISSKYLILHEGNNLLISNRKEKGHNSEVLLDYISEESKNAVLDFLLGDLTEASVATHLKTIRFSDPLIYSFLLDSLIEKSAHKNYVFNILKTWNTYLRIFQCFDWNDWQDFCSISMLENLLKEISNGRMDATKIILARHFKEISVIELLENLDSFPLDLNYEELLTCILEYFDDSETIEDHKITFLQWIIQRVYILGDDVNIDTSDLSLLLIKISQFAEKSCLHSFFSEIKQLEYKCNDLVLFQNLFSCRIRLSHYISYSSVDIGT